MASKVKVNQVSTNLDPRSCLEEIFSVWKTFQPGSGVYHTKQRVGFVCATCFKHNHPPWLMSCVVLRRAVFGLIPQTFCSAERQLKSGCWRVAQAERPNRAPVIRFSARLGCNGGADWLSRGSGLSPPHVRDRDSSCTPYLMLPHPHSIRFSVI